MGNPVKENQIVPSTPELEEEVRILMEDLFGSDLFVVDMFKRTKKFINGKGNEATRKLLPGEEPEFRCMLVQTKVTCYNKGGLPAYDRKAKKLTKANIFNEKTRALENSFASIGWENVIALYHGGYVYHRNNGFKPMPKKGFVAKLIA